MMKPRLNFKVEITYQPINNTYSCKIVEGNETYFEVDENISICVDKCIKKYLDKYET